MALRPKIFAAKLAAVLISALLLAAVVPLPLALKDMASPAAAWLGLIPLIIVIRTSRPKAAFWWSFLTGLLYWAVWLIWLIQLRNSWGYLPVVILSWLGLAAYCALYTGIFGLLLATVFPDTQEADTAGSIAASKRAIRRLAPLVMAPIFWVALEYLRGVVGTGFPWNDLGVSQYENIAAIQVAAAGGVYAVSALIVLLNTAIALTALRIAREVFFRLPRTRFHYELMLGLTVVAVCWFQGVGRVKHWDAQRSALSGIRTACVQPNIPQLKKWTEDYHDESYEVLRRQSALAVSVKPDLVIWPETATPDFLTIDPTAQEEVYGVVTNGCYLLVGSMDFEQVSPDRIDLYNSSFLVNSNGHIDAVYSKRHLVPFGEYIPFENQFAFIKRMAPLGFSCMPGKSGPLLEIHPAHLPRPVKLGVLICFEDTFPYLARKDVRRGARILINQTNDSWFDPSPASAQHMANAVFRAVENRTPLVRCANSGVTCYIDRFGRVIDKLADDRGQVDIKGFCVSQVLFEVGQRAMTPYTRFGDWLFAIPCATLTILWLLWLGRAGFARVRRET